MFHRSRTIMASAAAVSVLGLGALTLTATSAFAGQGGGSPEPSCSPSVQPWGKCPTPKPTPTQPTPTPTVTITPPPVVTPTLTQQEFDLVDTTVLPNGWVLGTGPISIVGGIDKTTSNPRVDFFDTADGTSGVRINHEPLFGAQIDRRTCSIGYDQFDLPWSIHFGFGRFAGAVGNGVYDLKALFSFPTRNMRCTLPYYLTPGQADWDLNHGGGGLPTPLAVTVDVQAVGRAFVPTPNPKPCPTRSVFAPVTGSPAPYNTCSPSY